MRKMLKLNLLRFSFSLFVVFFGLTFSKLSIAETKPHKCRALVKKSFRHRNQISSNKSSPLFGDLKSIRVMSFNLYNLYTHQGRGEYRTPDGRLVPAIPRRPKNHKKLEQQAAAILDHAPEFVVVQEVEGSSVHTSPENLASFAKNELKNLYIPQIVDSTNDYRNLAIGFLVRADIAKGFRFKVVSHADRMWYNPGPQDPGYHHVFTRDFPVLLMKKHGAKDWSFAIGGVHLKSQRDYGQGFQSTRERATREVREIVRIMSDFRRRFPDTPFMLSGDFNAHIGTSPELFDLNQKLGLKEAMRLRPRPATLMQRTTAFYFEDGVHRHFKQVDGHFLSHHLHKYVKDAWVYRYRDDRTGQPLPIPRTYAERESLLPSDHYPIIVEISTKAFKQ